MANMNKVLVAGNLGKDPEMRFTPGGSPVTTFSVAANRKYKKGDGEKVEATEWFNVVCWNKLAESCNQFLSKGSNVFIEGRLTNRSWEKDGEKHYRVEIVAQQVSFLNTHKEEGTEEEVEEAPEQGPEQEEDKKKAK